MLTEALFSAVAEAVFGYLLEESDLSGRVRAVLGVNPERRAFQTALARAYATFSRRYPDLAASLFDEHFLKTEAAPLLAELLTRRGRPDPADLAHRWAAHLGHPDPEAWPRLAEATRAAADFLVWLEEELAEQPALRPLWDARALERIAEDTEAIRRRLDEAFRQALAQVGEFDRALTAAEGIGNDLHRADALTALAQVAAPGEEQAVGWLITAFRAWLSSTSAPVVLRSLWLPLNHGMISFTRTSAWEPRRLCWGGGGPPKAGGGPRRPGQSATCSPRSGPRERVVL